MATYKEIFGTNIEVLASDPANPVTGQVWYNSTDNVVKGAALTTAGAWATGGNLNTARGQGNADGTQTSALFAGGIVFPGPPPAGIMKNETELYNGTSWTEVNNLNLSRGGGAGSKAGSQTASIFFGGRVTTPTPADKGETETWNGTNWTEVADMNSARVDIAGAGIVTSALAFGNGPLNESWNGTSWTEVADLNRGRGNLASAGVDNTSALAFGGDFGPGFTGETESWNGTSWTELADMNVSRRELGGAGTQTAALAIGGVYLSPGGTVASNATESWDGTSWTTEGTLNTARFQLENDGAGSSTAGLVTGGNTSYASASMTNATEEFTGAGAPVTVTFTDS
jgi:hypothetical protein